MTRGIGDRETLLEVGLIAAGVTLLGGVALLFFGRASGSARRGKRHAEGPPSPGSVAPDRHQHIQATSGR
jgi:hypothetical protein